MIFAIILLLLLTASVFYNVASYASHAFLGYSPRYSLNRGYGPKLEEVVLEENGAANKIAVIEVRGIITSQVIDQGGFSMVEVLKAELRRAEEDDRVRAVILKVDSPGGEVLASDEINRALSDFQKKAGKPVIASMGDLAASGGYYVSVPCRWIVANELSITGSIGVIMHSWNYRGLMDKVGVLPEVYKSGRFKDMLSGAREPDQVTPEERRMLQTLINETFGKFKSVVANGREQAYKENKSQGRALAHDWAEYADGRILSGKEAYELGFVDQLGSFEDAVNRAKSIEGIRNANVVQFQQRYDFSDLFRLFGKTGMKQPVVKLDWGGAEMPKLQAGRLYFLSPTFLH